MPLPPNAVIPASWRVYSGGHRGRWPAGLAGGGIGSLFVTPGDELWAAIGGNPIMYREGRWHTSRLPALPRPELQGYGIGPFAWYRGRLWAGGALPLTYNRGEWRLVEGVPFAVVRQLAVDAEGRLWAGTLRDGLWRTPDGQDWERILLPREDADLTALWCGEQDTVWVAQSGRGAAGALLHRWGEGGWEALASSGPRDISALTGDVYGGLWVGTWGRGVFRWAEGHWTRARVTADVTRPGVPGGHIHALVADRRGRVWVAAQALGVYTEGNWRLAVVAPEQSSTARAVRAWVSDSDSHPPPTCLHLDAAERLWVGTLDGHVGWVDTAQEALPPDALTISGHYEPDPIHPVG